MALTKYSDQGYPLTTAQLDANWTYFNNSKIVSVKDYGAVGDGVTDDYAAIVAADAAAYTAGVCLYFPSGTYISSSRIVMTAPSWKGDARETSIIKAQSSASISNLVHVGPTSGTTTKTFCSVQGMGFNGNSGCTDSVFKLRNVQHSAFRELLVHTGANAGFKTDTSTASINTNQLRNEYSDIVCHSNAGKGFHFIGEKDARFDNLFAHDNGSDGFLFAAFVDDGNNLAETTECTITSLLSRDNDGNGFTFDMIEKYVAGSLESAINGQRGFYFQSSITTAASNGSNSLVCGAMLSRNDAFGAFEVAETAYVYGVKVGSLIAYGFNSTLDYPGMIIRGGQAMDFGNVLVQGFDAGAVYIQDGTPYGGGTAQASKVHFGVLTIRQCGHASAATNGGLTISNSSADITIDCLISENSYTNSTTGFYELTVASGAGPVHIGYAHLTAAEDGYEVNISTSETYIAAYKRRTEKAAISLLNNGTTPTVSLTNHALLYVDNADGDLKVRFSNGTVATIASN